MLNILELGEFKLQTCVLIKNNNNNKNSNSGDDDDEYRALDANKVLNEFGSCGRYQLLSYVLCQFTNFFYAVSIFNMVFVGKKPTYFICNIDQSSTSELIKSDNQCQLRDTKTGNQFRCGATGSGTKIFTNDTEAVNSLPYQVEDQGFEDVFGCALIFVPITSHLSDLYGRRTILLVSLYTSVVLSIATSFSPNYPTFVTLRFFVGAASDTYLTIASILCCETVASKFRDWTSLVGIISWLLGYTYVGALDLIIKDWQKLYLFSALPGFITIIYWCLLPESPHWMISRERVNGVKYYIKTSSWFNGRTIDLGKCRADSDVVIKSQRVKDRTICDICRSKRLIFMIIINGYITLVMNFYYFAISLDSINLCENKFVGYVLSGLSEIPGAVIVIPLLHFFGRRTVTIMSFFMQGSAVLIAPFVRDVAWATLSCNLFGRMINEVAFATHPLFANEMMPTTIRTISYSIVNIPQSVGIMLSPLLKYTDLGDGKVPCFILATLSFLAAMLALTLPETKDKPMPEDIDELDPGPFLGKFIARKQSKKQLSSEKKGKKSRRKKRHHRVVSD